MEEKRIKAHGKKGIIIQSSDEMMFRVFEENGEFRDYALRNSDIEVIIADKDAELILKSNGECIINHDSILGKDMKNT